MTMGIQKRRRIGQLIRRMVAQADGVTSSYVDGSPPRRLLRLGHQCPFRILIGVQNALALSSTFGSQVPVQSIHASKGLLTAITREWSIVEVQLFVTLAIVLSCETLATAGPLALEWPFFVMRSHMTFEVEASRKGAATAWHRTHKVCLLLPSTVASTGCALACDSLFGDCYPGGGRLLLLRRPLAKHGCRSERHVWKIFIANTWARRWAWIWARTVRRQPTPAAVTAGSRTRGSPAVMATTDRWQGLVGVQELAIDEVLLGGRGEQHRC